jgi:hypothetical protein
MIAMSAARKNFFFEKKKQKTFVNWCPAEGAQCQLTAAQCQKFFGSFFQKRTFLLLTFTLPRPWTGDRSV